MVALAEIFFVVALAEIFFVVALAEIFFVVALAEIFFVVALAEIFFVVALAEIFFVVALVRFLVARVISFCVCPNQTYHDTNQAAKCEHCRRASEGQPLGTARLRPVQRSLRAPRRTRRGELLKISFFWATGRGW